jgi:hypothetical protein
MCAVVPGTDTRDPRSSSVAAATVACSCLLLERGGGDEHMLGAVLLQMPVA